MNVPQAVFPTLRYRDTPAAISWLTTTFGLEEKAVYADANGTVQHAELDWAGNIIMLGTAPGGSAAGSSWLYLIVADPDAHHARATAAGAEVVHGLTDQDYGSREYTARDPEGNLWTFGTYIPG